MRKKHFLDKLTLQWYWFTFASLSVDQKYDFGRNQKFTKSPISAETKPEFRSTTNFNFQFFKVQLTIWTHPWIIMFLLQKSLTIFHSALYGGAVITTGLDYFVAHSVMLMWVWDRVRIRESPPICWYAWAITAMWPLTFCLGKLFFQIQLLHALIWWHASLPLQFKRKIWILH